MTKKATYEQLQQAVALLSSAYIDTLQLVPSCTDKTRQELRERMYLDLTFARPLATDLVHVLIRVLCYRGLVSDDHTST
jgi:hypothetical protein